MSKITVDPKCALLAEEWLEDPDCGAANIPYNVNSLPAGAIQEAIEDWFESRDAAYHDSDDKGD